MMFWLIKREMGQFQDIRFRWMWEVIKISSIGSQQCVNKLLTSFSDRYSHSQERVSDKTN